MTLDDLITRLTELRETAMLRGLNNAGEMPVHIEITGSTKDRNGTLDSIIEAGEAIFIGVSP